MREKPKPIAAGSVWEVASDFIMVQEGAYCWGSKYHRGQLRMDRGTRFVVENAGGNKFWNIVVWGKKCCMPAFKIHKKCKEL